MSTTTNSGTPRTLCPVLSVTHRLASMTWTFHPQRSQRQVINRKCYWETYIKPSVEISKILLQTSGPKQNRIIFVILSVPSTDLWRLPGGHVGSAVSLSTRKEFQNRLHLILLVPWERSGTSGGCILYPQFLSTYYIFPSRQHSMGKLIHKSLSLV